MRTFVLFAFTFTAALTQMASAEEQNQTTVPPAKNRSKALPPPAPHFAPKVQGHAPGPVKAIPPPRVNTWQRSPNQARVPRQLPPNTNQYVQPKQRVPNPYLPQTIERQPAVRPAVVAVQPEQHTRNWDNDRPRDRRNNIGGNHWTTRPPNLIPWREACQRHQRNHHHRDWWRSHYTRFCLFGTGYYFWDAGYWYPAYGYDVAYNTYPYEAPIVAYADMEPAEVVARVQEELQRLGYYQYEADGLMGPETQSALADFQRDNGLEITSAIDEPTLELLGLE